jgi:peptidyl-tRNA hydrolase
MKMYICLKDDLSVGMAMNSAAHAGLMCHLSFVHKENYNIWLNKSFKKVTCAVTPAEFAMLKELPDTQLVTESRMNGQEVGIVLCPRPDTEWPEFVNLLKLWK